MPLPPTDPFSANPRAYRPAWARANSPLAMSVRVLAARRRTRVVTPSRALRVAGMAGAALVHMLFLLLFVLGPAYEIEPPPDVKAQVLQVRLIDTPEPPPAPSKPAEVPKQVGPTHQGDASRAAPARKNVRSANQVSVPTKPAPPVTTPVAAPAVAKAVAPTAPEPKPVAAPKPPASLPKPAPTPDLQPIPLAGEPPSIAVETPSLKPPMPPDFQPEPVRRPQLEGTVAVPPPPSLALPPLPQEVPPPISVTSMAMTMDVPKSSAPVSVVVARPQMPAAPAVPELQAIPLPAQEAPNVKLDAQPSALSPVTPQQLPRLQAPSIVVAEAQLEAVPSAPAKEAEIALSRQAVKVTNTDKAPIAPLPVQRPQLSQASAAEASAVTPAESASPASTPNQVAAAAEKPAVTSDAAASEGEKKAEPDVSTAPNASAQGSDTAKLGDSTVAPTASTGASAQTASAATAATSGAAKTNAGKGNELGERGGHQAGAAQGAKQGELGGYIQLKPTGDTTIMSHRVPGITYKATRFEQDWTPEGESSIDTALRRAIEKTSVKHTFHLPRGIRIKCVVRPLMPLSLLGCGGADPPPKLVSDEVYKRLNLAPAKPLVAPEPAATVAAPAPMVKLNNAAQCAAAHVAGSPPPPGCPESETPSPKAFTPAPASSSWVPASDQFH